MVQIEELRSAFVARLKKALATNEIPEWGAGARLAKMAGVTPKATSKWMNGESMPGGAKMLAIANALKVRVEWLEYGRGDMREGASPVLVATPSPDILPFASSERDGAVTDEKYAFIPQYTAMASAGVGHDNPHIELRGTLAFKREWLRIKGVNPKHLKVIYADGNSMWPTISDHDVLLVDESRVEPADGQIFVMFSQTKGTIVKRLIESNVGGWIIRSDNPDKISHGDQVLPDEEIHEHRILGRVIWRGGDL
ncbi:S24 family peptidase [Pseudomonas sp.]|uniref:S24 family peptidase n=1 Tax=Pseudomonas sp. TaxID=306 RepID=UPI0032679014